jgi:two-component system OmpR family sensor kinase
LRRLTIRLKLTLAFAGVMAFVLTGIGTFLYLRFERDMRASVDEGLRSRANDVATLVRHGDSAPAGGARGALGAQGGGFAEALDVNERVVDATPDVGTRRLLGPGQLANASHRELTFDRTGAVEAGEPERVLAAPIAVRGQRLVVVVGTSLEQRDEALTSLLTLLLVGGPVALLLASLAGYGVTAAALRPRTGSEERD